MPDGGTEFINRILQNFQAKFKDAGDKLCDKSWACADSRFPYDSIGYVKKGQIFMSVNGRGNPVGEGGLYYIPAMALYSHHVIGETADVYWTHFVASGGISDRLEFPVSCEGAQAAQALYERIFERQRSESLGYMVELTGLIYGLASCFFGLCAEKTALSTGEEPMRQVAEFINGNLGRDLTVELLAGQTGLNPNYFIKVFHDFFHQSPIQFVLDRREEAARKMLEDPYLSVKEIGFSLGFSNQNYFSEFFKKRSGCSPSAYRRLKGIAKDYKQG